MCFIADSVNHCGNGSKNLIINALLDHGSTQTYLNADFATKLGLHGKITKKSSQCDKWDNSNL